MNVLVIGGSRFMGYLAIWRLLAAGHRVAVLNRGSTPDPFGSRIERLRGDRADLEAVLAGRTFDAAMDFVAFVERDARQAERLLRSGAFGHYVFIGTGQVYLVREGCPFPAREEDYAGEVMARPTDPRDVSEWEYGVGKRACEDVLAAPGLAATRLRIPVVNGERDPYGRIAGYLCRILDGGPVVLPDGGTNKCRHVYATDVAATAVSLLGDRRAFGKVWNLSQDEQPTVVEVVTKLAALVGAPVRIEAVPASRFVERGIQPKEISSFSQRWMSNLDPSRAKSEIGFRPTPLDAQLAQITAAWLANPTTPEGYKHRPVELELARRS